jgi:hypothetical protein
MPIHNHFHRDRMLRLVVDAARDLAEGAGTKEADDLESICQVILDDQSVVVVLVVESDIEIVFGVGRHLARPASDIEDIRKREDLVHRQKVAVSVGGVVRERGAVLYNQRGGFDSPAA